MPTRAIDYSKTVIYKIVCNDLTITDLYVGSTINFTKRKSDHKHNCIDDTKKNHHLKIYKTIRDNGNWANWTMVQIEEFPCANGNEARTRERYWFEQLNATLNMAFPTRTMQEYREHRKEHIKNYGIDYYSLHKERINQQHKKYRIANKDIICKNAKEYQIANKDKIKEYRATPYTCECGATFKKSNIGNHKNTKKHINYLNLQKENI